MYVIDINNRTGDFQQYSLVAALPHVTGPTTPKVWSSVVAWVQAGGDQGAALLAPKQLLAVAGNSHGPPAFGVGANVPATKPVNLGTAIELSVRDGRPQISEATPSRAIDPSAFELRTDGSFTASEAKNMNLIVGLGVSHSDGDDEDDEGGGYTGSSAVFTPQPNQWYKIKPRMAFYLTAEQYGPGSLIDVVRLGNYALEIDFSKTPGIDRMSVIHRPDGRLVFR
ncbi:hypothetical protein FGADI_5798 [Fusarium gaditjirri]|uniref:Uncharacterized protein n=1 Tax=Fusarium gaditjirri TaxID=282569 RepID=A0A8H4WXJ8_9HYPO|nr:hypothetical protein FGADI_5798 [Fusarium gaditjirri]